MSVKSLMIAATIALMTLSGCASTGAGNTTYAQWQGPYPQPDYNAGEGGVRIPY